MQVSFLNTDQYVHDLKIVKITPFKNDTCTGVKTLGKPTQNKDTSEKQVNNMTIHKSFN